ncbi:MAG: hypothetical protein AB7K09_00875 [Planctomycetota bacterium]
MQRIWTIAIYEFRALLGLRATPAVIGIAWLMIFLGIAAAGNGVRDMDTLAGEWSAWGRVCGQWCTAALVLLSVYCGAVRYDGVRRDARGVSLASLPVRGSAVVLGMLLGRMMLTAAAGLLPLLVGGWLHASPGALGVQSELTQVGAITLAALLAVGYLVSGTFLLAVLLPRAWMALLVGSAGGLLHQVFAWYTLPSGNPAIDEFVFRSGTALNPVWGLRVTSLGLMPYMLGAVGVAIVLHSLVAVQSASLVRVQYDINLGVERLRYSRNGLLILLVPALLAFGGLATGSALVGPVAGFDLTRAQVTEPGPRHSAIWDLEAWIDPVTRFDAPLQGAYFLKLSSHHTSQTQRIWHAGLNREQWEGVLLTSPSDHRVLLDTTGGLKFSAPYRAARALGLSNALDMMQAQDMIRLLTPLRSANMLTTMESLAVGMADSNADEPLPAAGSGETLARDHAVIIGPDKPSLLLNTLTAEGYEVHLGETQLMSLPRKRTLAVVQPGDDISAHQAELLELFQQQGGAVLVMLPPVQPSEIPQTQIAGLTVPRMANDRLPRPNTQLAKLLQTWGVLYAQAELTCNDTELAAAALVDELQHVHWRAVAEAEVLAAPGGNPGAVPVAVGARRWAMEAVPRAEGDTQTPMWRPVISTQTDSPVRLRVPRTGEELQITPVVLALMRDAGTTDMSGPLAVTSLEPFARVGADGQPGFAGDDERDLLCNLVAHMAGRPADSARQHRKALVRPLAGAGVDAGFVVVHEIIGWTALGLGLALMIVRWRRKVA